MISIQLRDAIDNCDWTLNAIAAEAGIPHSVVYRWYVGEKQHDGSMRKRDLSLKSVDALAKVFGMRLTKPKKIKS